MLNVDTRGSGKLSRRVMITVVIALMMGLGTRPTHIQDEHSFHYLLESRHRPAAWSVFISVRSAVELLAPISNVVLVVRRTVSVSRQPALQLQ